VIGQAGADGLAFDLLQDEIDARLAGLQAEIADTAKRGAYDKVSNSKFDQALKVGRAASISSVTRNRLRIKNVAFFVYNKATRAQTWPFELPERQY